MTDGVRGSNLPTGTDLTHLIGITVAGSVKTSKQIAVADLPDLLDDYGLLHINDDGTEISVTTTTPAGDGAVVRDEVFFYRPADSWQSLDGIPGNNHDEYTSIYFGPPHVGGLNSDHNGGVGGHSPSLETFFNTGYGQYALYEITTGSYNDAFGHEALRENTVGAWNTAFGEAAGCNNAEGDSNTWMGLKTGLGLLGITDCSNNVGIGYLTMAHIGVGASNVAVGYSCMGNVGVTIEADTLSGGFNVAVGGNIATGIKTGNRNTMMGHAAGADLIDGAFNIFLGYNAGQGLTTGTNNIVIGFVDNLTTTQANTLTISNPGSGAPYVYGDGTTYQIRAGSKASPTIVLEVVKNVASVVNYLRVTGAATGNGAILGTFGTDAAVNLLFQTRQSSAQATRMILGLGLQVGATPTGGDKGAGTINVSGDIYKNNTAYTNPDYVFEHFYTGKVAKYAGNPGATAWAKAGGLKSLIEIRDFAKANLRLPWIDDEPTGIFERADVSLREIESLYLHLFEMHDRVSKLEATIH